MAKKTPLLSDARKRKLMAHPTRVDVLVAMATLPPLTKPLSKFKKSEEIPGLSPVDLHERFGLTLGGLAYHVRILCKYGLIELVDEVRVRGAVEHKYRATTLGLQLLDGYKQVQRSNKSKLGKRTPEEILEAILALDLGRLHTLVEAITQESWSKAHFERILSEYQKFLVLCAIEDATQLVPSYRIRPLWWAHVLDTEGYARDCEQALGFYLEHDPFRGLRSVEDEAEYQRQIDVTMELMAKTFGSDARHLELVKAA